MKNNKNGLLIIFDKPVPVLVFSGGEQVSGIVQLTVAEEMKMFKLKLLVSGEETFSEGSTNLQSKKNYNVIKQIEIPLTLPGDNKKQKKKLFKKRKKERYLDAGIFVFPWKFDLPSVLPPTFEKGSSSIKYRVGVIAQSRKKKVVLRSKTVEIRVLGSLFDPCFLMKYNSDIEKRKEITFRPALTLGKISIIYQGGRIFYVGDSITGSILILNSCTKKISEFEISLKKRTKIGKYTEEENLRTLKFKEIKGGINNKEWIKLDFNFQVGLDKLNESIPEELVKNIKNVSLKWISLEYVIKCVGVLEKTKNIKAEIVIFLKNRSDDKRFLKKDQGPIQNQNILLNKDFLPPPIITSEISIKAVESQQSPLPSSPELNQSLTPREEDMAKHLLLQTPPKIEPIDPNLLKNKKVATANIDNQENVKKINFVNEKVEEKISSSYKPRFFDPTMSFDLSFDFSAMEEYNIFNSFNEEEESSSEEKSLNIKIDNNSMDFPNQKKRISSTAEELNLSDEEILRQIEAMKKMENKNESNFRFQRNLSTSSISKQIDELQRIEQQKKDEELAIKLHAELNK